MQFRDLGPLTLEVDGIERPLNGRRLESVLAPLVAEAGRVVTVDALIDAVWGATAPDRAAQSLESLIWRLRKVLEPERSARQVATVLQTAERGYRLAVRTQAVDSHQLLEAGAAVAELLATGRAGAAVDAAALVLDRWRGQPYLGVPDAAWLPPVRARLEEAHVALQQQHVQALLAAGRPERALTELLPLLAAHPHREELWAQRMLALYRSGRQGEALQAFADARAALAGELGVDPGPGLRELHRRVLEQDPRLEPEPGRDALSVPSAASPVGAPARLPGRRAALVGRDRDIAALRPLLVPPVLVTLTGPGGAGKTRLAVEMAHLQSASHPDGTWFVDLSDVTEDGAVWPRIVSTIGLGAVPGSGPETGPHRLAVAFLTARRVLLVLDNCEQVLDQARAVADVLLDACPAVTVLATSREPLDVPGEYTVAVRPLRPPTDGDPLVSNPAVTLFLQRLGAGGDAGVDLAGPDGVAVARICRAVDGLPLGLELAAARARTFELAEVARALEGDPAGLTRPGGGPLRHLTLRDTVEWSHRLAREPEQVLHRRLSVIAGPVTLPAAQMLCDLPPLQPGQAMDLLAGLVHRSLLTARPVDRPAGGSAFAQLVPIRAHAGGCLVRSGEADAVGAARDRWFARHVLDAPHDGREGQAAWYDWLEDNSAVLTATLNATVLDAPGVLGARLCQALLTYWFDRGLLVEGIRWVEAAHRAAGPEPLERACAQATYGSALALNLDPDRAAPLLRAAIPVLVAAGADGDRQDQARRAGQVLVLVGACAWAADLWTDAERAARAALALPTGDPHVTLRARAILTACRLLAGEPEDAVRDAQNVLTDDAKVGNHFAAFFACVTLGIAARFRLDAASGLHWSAQALRHQLALGVRNTGDTLEQRGSHFVNAERWDAAVRCYGASAVQSEREGRPWPHHPGTEQALALLRTRLTPGEFDRNWAGGQRLGRDTRDWQPASWA